MNQQQHHAPADLLPALLQQGRQTVALRELIQPVLGERGRWLAGLNPDWAWGHGVQEQADTETQWAQGSLEQRRAVLLAQRHSTPDAARERLQGVWGELPARDRHALIGTLKVGLSASDEAFLTHQLQKDRAQDVRCMAADLLAALPQSAFSQRMVARLRPLVQVAPAPPAKATNSSPSPGEWHIDAPLEASASCAPPPPAPEDPYKSDWPDAQRPKHDTLGERAWLLYQLVRRSPLSWWTQHTGRSPNELLDTIDQNDWAEALVRGWTHAALTQHDPAWCLALLTHPRLEASGHATALLSQLDAPTQEQHLLHQWTQWTQSTSPKKKRHWSAVVDDLVRYHDPHAVWGEQLSTAMAQFLDERIRQGELLQELQQHHTLTRTLRELACLLHPQALGVLSRLPASIEHNSSLTERLHGLHHLIDLRQTLRHLCTPTPS